MRNFHINIFNQIIEVTHSWKSDNLITYSIFSNQNKKTTVYPILLKEKEEE